MSKLKFTSDMFFGRKPTATTLDEFAKTAQEIFDEWLEEQPVIYGRAQKALSAPDVYWQFHFSDPQGRQNQAVGHEDTHKARLVCIEEIKPCEHKNEEELRYMDNCGGRDSWLRCKDCGQTRPIPTSNITFENKEFYLTDSEGKKHVFKFLRSE